MKAIRAVFPIWLFMGFFILPGWAASDSEVFPNHVESSPPQPQGPQVIAVPQPAQTPDAGTLSPQNMSQMGMGVQIPLGGTPAEPTAPTPSGDSDAQDAPGTPNTTKNTK